MTVTTVKINGMTCGHCEGRVNTELSKLVGVSEVTVSAATAEAVVVSMNELDPELISSAVLAAGYNVIR